MRSCGGALAAALAARAASGGGGAAFLGRQHGADTPARVRRRRRRAAGDVEDLGAAVVGDEVAGDLVGRLAAAQSAHGRVVDEADDIGLAVVLEPLGVADDVLVGGVALLAEGRVLARRAEGDGGVVAVRRLAHLDAIGPDRHRPLGDHDVAVEDHILVEQVDLAGQVGLDVERLEAVGLLGLDRRGGHGGQAGEHEGEEAEHRRGGLAVGAASAIPHSGMNLAGHSMPPTCRGRRELLRKRHRLGAETVPN